MIDPAFYRGIEFGEGNLAGAILGPVRPQPPREFDDVARFDAALRGINDKAQSWDAVRTGNDLRRRFVDRQAQAA